jgi:hypothetical protein
MRKALLLLFLLMATAGAAGAAPHRVLAFYYNWYGTPQLENGRWQHWNECRACVHNPGRTVQVTSPRNGEKLTVPDTGTKNHPARLYDSNDPAVIRQHLRMAERAGLDAFITTWWGRDSYHDRALRQALAVAREMKSPVKFTIYYETLPRGATDPVRAVIEDFRYLIEQYGSNPAFLTEGRAPVFFVYGRAMSSLKPEQWTEAIAGIRVLGRVVLISDGLAPRWLDLFDGLHEYNPVGRIVEKTDMLARYRSTVANCRAKAKDKISTATIIPGYDDSNIGREKVTVAGREKGELYKRLWQYALDANPDWVLITSFNEWHEGSEIEPSVEWGDLFLNLTREYSRRFKAQR